MKIAVLYTSQDCPRCAQAATALSTLGYNVVERSADALVRGEYQDAEALTELTMNDGALPVIVVDGEAIREGDELFANIKECDT